MEPVVRRLLTFDCEGAQLGATIDAAAGETGILIVTGGSQTRIGSHRLFERLAARLAAAGHPCFRFDRRGVGDSGGDDPGYRESGPDLASAVTSFRAEAPDLKRIIGLGLCDGATALALHGGAAGADALILVNPWLVEAEADAPPPAAIRQHYRQRLSSLQGWKRLLTGSVSYRKLFKGILKASNPLEGSALAVDVAQALRRTHLPTALILAKGDATAIAAAAEIRTPPFRRLIGQTREVDTDSHTFAKPGDLDALVQALLDVMPDLVRREGA